MNNLSRLYCLLAKQFPDVVLPVVSENLMVGEFVEWDSLAHFDFLLSVEQEFEIRFGVDEMAELKSFADILDVVQKQKKSND
jgi:acyl carrier protein